MKKKPVIRIAHEIEYLRKELSWMITQLEKHENKVPDSYDEKNEQRTYANVYILLTLEKVSLMLPGEIQPLVTRLLEQERVICTRHPKSYKRSVTTGSDDPGNDEQESL